MGKSNKRCDDIIIFQGFYLYIAYANLSGRIKKIPILNINIEHTTNYVYRILVVSIVGFMGALVFLGILYYINKSKNFPKVTLDKVEDKLDYIIENYNGATLTHYVYLDDKYIYLNKDKDVLIQYQICQIKFSS